MSLWSAVSHEDVLSRMVLSSLSLSLRIPNSGSCGYRNDSFFLALPKMLSKAMYQSASNWAKVE